MFQVYLKLMLKLGEASVFSRRLSSFDELEQLLEVVEVVIVSHDALSVVGDASSLVALEAVEEVRLAKSPGEFGEAIGLDFGKKSLVAGIRAFVAVSEPSRLRACSNLTSGGVWAQP